MEGLRACRQGLPYSCFPHLLSFASTPKECVASTNSSLLLSKVSSHLGLLSLVATECSTKKELLQQTEVYLTQHCLSASTHPVSRLSKILLLFLFPFDCISLTANRVLANRGSLARGSKQAFLNSIIYINSRMDCYLGLLPEALYHKQ